MYDAEYDGENPPEKSPIYGMSPDQFHQLMLEDSFQFRLDQDNIEKAINGLGPQIKNVRKMKVGKTDK